MSEMRPESTSALLSMASRERIDRVCLNFEDAWQASKSPQITDFLAEFRGPERAALLKELLLLEIDYLRQQGVEPSAEQYFSRFPDDRPIVAEVFRSALPATTVEMAPGQRIGRYSIERNIGRGSFGTVYQAWDTELERYVAIKIPRADRFGESRDIDDFVEEARTAAKLDHPAIVPVLDVVRNDEGTPLIVMQFVEGRSLRDQLVEGEVPREQAVQLLVQLAEGIDYAHRRGFIHRDLEPRNILLDAAGNPHITDFGLAIHESTQRARAGESAGSLAYMSPEQLRGESQWLDGRSDVWAVGVIMYELLTGRRPFGGKSFEEIASEIFVREPKPLRQINAAIPVELEQICLKCLSKNPAHRYATAHDLATALRESLLDGGAVPAAESGQAILARGNKAVRRNWVMALAGLGIAALLAVAIGAAYCAVFCEPNPAAQASGSLVESIQLAVWTEKDEYRGRIGRGDQSASPLRQGDKVRLDVLLDRPAYLYVLWIGTDGDVTPIYPWSIGKWARGDQETPIRNLSLPAVADQTWQVGAGSAGAETIVALVTDKPLPSDLVMTTLLQRIRPQSGTSWDVPLWFDNGRLAPTQESKQRSPNVTTPHRLDDPVVANQLLVSEQLKPYCVTIQALCFPITGE